MNREDMANFIESLNEEQFKAFEKVFKEIGNSVGVEVKEEKETKKEEVVSSEAIVGEDFRVTNTKSELERGRKAVRARKNRWEDTGEWSIPEGEEEWGDSRKRSTRNRSKTKKVKLECSVCGKTYMENPNLVYGEYHRCNRCGGK